MKSMNRVAKKEVHPLCSRKKSLMKIVSSPSYKERQSKLQEKSRPERKRKLENETPKFEFLKRKKRYGDDLLSRKKEEGSIMKENNPLSIPITPLQEKQDAAKTPLRAERKSFVHPLCSRQKSLSKIVSSPSYKLPLRSTKVVSSLYNVPPKPSLRLPTRSPCINRRHTIMPSIQDKENKRRISCNVPSSVKNKENHESMGNLSEIASPSYTSTIRKSSFKERRCTMFAKWKPNGNIVSFAKEEEKEEEEDLCVMTPWRNNKKSMRERLDLWLASKNKALTPCEPKRYQKSPFPNRKFKSTQHLKKLNEEDSTGNVDYVQTPKCFSSEENGAVISKEFETILEKLENNVNREEVEKDLDGMISKYTTVVKFADYWICKARLASLDDDVQRVICMLEQAHAFQAQPGEKIREEICRYLEQLESYEQNGCTDEDNFDEEREKLVTLYAITPGRRVHFAAVDSPVDFKSSVIRFCLLESKAFKRRLNAQLKRKVLTPVRRSMRVERSELPDFLRADNRVVNSPGEVEGDIIDGEVTFVPNTTIDTPLNKGWLIQDERNIAHENGDEKVEGLELSFM